MPDPIVDRSSGRSGSAGASAAGNDHAPDKGTLKIGFRSSPVPLNFMEDGRLVRGLNKDIGDFVARRLNRTARYLPVKGMEDIEDAVMTGRIDLYCLWQDGIGKHPDAYGWSRPLFDTVQLFISLEKRALRIGTYRDLAGLTVGVLAGHDYPQLETASKRSKIGRVERMRTVDLLALLMAGRVDVVIGTDVIYRYLAMALGYKDRLRLSLGAGDPRTYRCIVSSRAKLAVHDLDNALAKLTEADGIAAMLERYK